MLKALYDYACRNSLILPAGFVRKNVRAYVLLDGNGNYVGVLSGSGDNVPCPDIGSLAHGPDKCNAMAEKRDILFPSEAAEAQNGNKYAAKLKYFIEMLESASRYEPSLELCIKALRSAETVAAVSKELDRLKLTGTSLVSFRINGQSILELPGVEKWWREFRKQFCAQGRKEPCLITGELTVPPATLPSVNGLASVGGHSSGDTLICFDKTAFCSYGLKQAANAPVSEDAFFGVKAALDELLQGAPVLAGMKFVHWYDRSLPSKEDELQKLISPFDDEEDEEGEDAQEQEVNNDVARANADKIVKSIYEATPVHELPDMYYILLLSGAGGRIMVRSYQNGNYALLTENIKQWERDLALVNASGTGLLKPVKLSVRLIRLLSRQNSESKIFERLGKELAGITPAVINAVINNQRLPDSVAARALNYLRSVMLASENAGADKGIVCQWIKAWLCRREREKYSKEELLVDYNENHPESAYHCGALLAVFGEIQRIAMPDVNAGIIDRYYASAIQSPALTLGQLSKLSNYHLSKIERLRRYFSDVRNSVACAVGEDIPAYLSPEQQAYFALGYYQMCAKLEKDRLNRKAEKQLNKAEEE